MAMTEMQLLTDLGTYFLATSPNPIILKAEDDKFVTRMSVEVAQIGLSQKDKKPIGLPDKSIQYFVYKRGQVGLESAYYYEEQPTNTSLKDVTIATSSYQAIANLYNSDILQNRVLAAIMTQCQAVFLEDVGAANHVNRMKLVSAANQNLLLVVMEFMCAVALNATVQSQGTDVIDATLLSIVSGAWNSYANLLVA